MVNLLFHNFILILFFLTQSVIQTHFIRHPFKYVNVLHLRHDLYCTDEKEDHSEIFSVFQLCSRLLLLIVFSLRCFLLRIWVVGIGLWHIHFAEFFLLLKWSYSKITKRLMNNFGLGINITRRLTEIILTIAVKCGLTRIMVKKIYLLTVVFSLSFSIRLLFNIGRINIVHPSYTRRRIINLCNTSFHS